MCFLLWNVKTTYRDVKAQRKNLQTECTQNQNIQISTRSEMYKEKEAANIWLVLQYACLALETYNNYTMGN